jgi:predicted dehydrogenase
MLSGLLGFSSGLIGLLDVNRVAPTRRRRVVVLGDTGLYEADCLEQALHFTPREPSTARVRLPVTRVDLLRAQHDAFLDALRMGRQPTVTGDDGLRAVYLADALLRSAAVHEAIEVGPAALPNRPAPPGRS